MPLILLLACNDRVWFPPQAVLSIESTQIDFPATIMGQSQTRTVLIENTGTAPQNMLLETTEPFSVARTQSMVPGENTITVSFQPNSYATTQGQLKLISPEVQLEIALTGSTVADGDGDGAAAIPAGGMDCDDHDSQRFPEAVDVCGDAVDQDCNGSDSQDCDGDGFLPPTDCDDQDPSRHPGLLDDTADHIDQDCDGMIDENLWTAGSLWISAFRTLAPATLEICGTPGIQVQGFVVRSLHDELRLNAAEIPETGCLGICESPTPGCSLVQDLLAWDAREDRLIFQADSVLDSLNWDTNWPDPGLQTRNLDPSHSSNNDQAAYWCLGDGNLGSPNLPCE